METSTSFPLRRITTEVIDLPLIPNYFNYDNYALQPVLKHFSFLEIGVEHGKEHQT